MASGGYRPGAGRPRGAKNKTKNQKTHLRKENLLPLEFMLRVMNDTAADKERRDRMAIAAAPFCHARKGEGVGKKEEKTDKAKQAGAGKFAPGRPPIALVKKR